MSGDTITLAHGAGGAAMTELIDQVFRPAFHNEWLDENEDQARLPVDWLKQPGDRLAFSTDSYVISPLTFPGGDIGKLAVCGTLNDLAVGGAIPRYLSISFILEEGMPLALLRQIVASMESVLAAHQVLVVTGDTKVVPRGKGDQVYINTTGIGVIPGHRQLSQGSIRKGDLLLVNGPVGNHGAVIADVRELLGFSTHLHSDCASLCAMIDTVLDAFPGRIRCLRDATRGGLAAVSNEFARGAAKHLQFREQDLPVAEPVAAICELLGFDPLYLANEGNALWVVDPAVAHDAVAVMRDFSEGAGAAIIGQALGDHATGWVTVKNALGTARMVDLPVGELLPRIC
ncbi:MAG: hydrogenase expression/formation protein HypE [Ketobacteraceae bacterium]|nr:hydrogenase expression/formation protein HypE [Ketobacteraceae bacterium]